MFWPIHVSIQSMPWKNYSLICVASVVAHFNAYVSFICFLPLFAVLTAVRDNFVLEEAVSRYRLVSALLTSLKDWLLGLTVNVDIGSGAYYKQN